jgi:hypothetical protein
LASQVGQRKQSMLGSIDMLADACALSTLCITVLKAT